LCLRVTYLGRNASMTTTAAELQEELEKAGLMELVEKYRGGEELDALCSRFIKARRGDKKKSFKMLKDYLLWCEKVGHVTAPL